MPRLPSSSDVQAVSPRVQSDPGVQIPAGSTQSTLGTAARELAPGLKTLSEVAIRKQNRRDAIDSAGRINQYFRGSDDLLRDINAENDLSEEKTLDEYASELNKRRQKLLSEFHGSEESRVSLAIRLQEIESTFIGRASAISTTLGREKVLTRFNDAITPLVNRAAQSPTRETIDELFRGLESNIGDLRGALDPNEEEKLRTIGREQIALSSLQSLINRGHFETADALIDQGGLVDALTPQSMRDIRGRIGNARTTHENILQEIQQAEQILGRPLNELEKLDKLGIRPTDRQNEIQDLIDRGLSPPLAKDIGNGNVRIMGPDNLGDFYAVNVVTNKSTRIVGDDKDNIGAMVGFDRQNKTPEFGVQEKQNQPGPKALDSAIDKGIGPASKIQAFVGNVIGPFREGSIFPDTAEARQQLRVFTQTAKTRLINNPRFPVAEQEIVRGLLPDPDLFFKDPDDARKELSVLRKHLDQSIDSKSREINSKITSKRRGELLDQISAINELLFMMDMPEESEKGDNGIPTLSTQEEVDNLPSGTQFIWGPANETLIKD